jgi:MOSC domain-containing protein YiiM
VAARGKLIAVCTSPRSGTPKAAIAVGVLCKGHGLVGDAHAGSPRQVSLLAEESIGKMKLDGFAVKPGDFAENLTTCGVELHRLPLGTWLRVGRDALLEVIQIGKECHADCEIRRRTGHCVMPREGVFATVVAGGEVRAGDEIVVLDDGKDAGGDIDGE